jgi:hypothetical protein
LEDNSEGELDGESDMSDDEFDMGIVSEAEMGMEIN